MAMAAIASEESSGIGADAALQKLMDGNSRFVSGSMSHPDQSSERRAEIVSAQHPFAVVVGCSDSRVPPEVLFDQGLGDIFVIRTAGEVMDNATIGSIEYAAEHLSVPLVVVLGHDSCGAVKAAVAGGEAPGQIAYLAEAIAPAVAKANETATKDELLNESIDVNTEMVVDQLKSTEPILSEYVKEGKLKIVGARYHLDSGKVDLL
ncbi:MAG TPA: carbonic anhydrase [Methanotrichaceae archaeon]|nr:carbonic anhydrase [Methanotrichaceae archaeon]